MGMGMAVGNGVVEMGKAADDIQAHLLLHPRIPVVDPSTPLDLEILHVLGQSAANVFT